MKHYILILILILANLSLGAKEPKRPDSYAFTRGVEAFDNGEPQEALDWFNKELREHPDNGYAYCYIAALRYHNEEYGKALSAINQSLKNLPSKDKKYKAIAYMCRARIYLKMGEDSKALKDYDMAIKLKPDDTDYRNERAQFYFERELYQLADADYIQMINIDPGDVMGYMGLGRNAKEQGLYEDAIKLFDYVIKMEPAYSSGYSFRAECYIVQKRYSEAIDDIVMALSLDGDYKAYYLLVTMDKTALPLIRTKLQIQAEKDPNNGLWYFFLGKTFQQHNQLKEAISFFEMANHLDHRADIESQIALCYFGLGEYSIALEYINQAIYLDETDYDFIEIKGNIYNEMGRYPEAIAELDRYIQKYPDDYYAYYRRGWFKDEANDSEGAINDYTMAITLNPQYAYAYLGRGRFYDERKEKELACADFKKVIELDTVPDPGSSCAQYAFYFLGQTDKAIAFMDSIIAKNEDRAGSYYDAACLYSLMNEKEKALDFLSKAFEVGYRRIAHIRVDHDLDNIRELPEYKVLIEKYSNNDRDERNEDFSESEDSMLEIPFTKEGSMTKVKCTVNDLALYFIFDTGASDVTMSMVEANFMLKNGYIKPEDIIGSARYMDANGDINENTVVNLRTIDLGGLELTNVRASIVRNQKAPLLLGQSVLGRLGKIEIDNLGLKLIITHKSNK